MCYVANQFRSEEDNEISIAESGQLGLPKWVTVPVFKTLSPKEFIVSYIKLPKSPKLDGGH